MGSGEQPSVEMMKDEGFGFMYKTSIEGEQLHFMGYSFVDDTYSIRSTRRTFPSTGNAHTSRYGHMGRWNKGYRRSIGAKKIILVPYSILLEEWTVGLCFKQGHTRFNISL
jgi:hypothetical protein